jgi:hypothetical protein
MPRKFVIVIDGINQQQERDFGSFLSEFGTWWHWLSNVWLLRTDEREADLSNRKLIEKIQQVEEYSNAVVLEIDNVKGYSTRLPEKSGSQSRDWLNKYFYHRDNDT